MKGGAELEGVAKAAGTVAQYSPFGPINTAILTVLTVLLAGFIRWQVTNRKMTIQVNGEIRAEFISEMTALRDEVKNLRRENDHLRDEVRSLHGVIDGMRRGGLAGHISAQRVVADSMPQSPEMASMLRSLGNIQGDVQS